MSLIKITPEFIAEFDEQNEIAKETGMKFAVAVVTIKKKELWRARFPSCKAWCESMKVSYSSFWKLLEAVEVKESLPDVEIPSVAVAVELAKVKSIPQRRQIVQEAMETGGRKLTVPAIKNAVKQIQRKKNPLDATGCEIPTEILDFWNRNEEVQFLLTSLSRVRQTLEQADEAGDKLFAKVDLQGSIAHLKMVYQELESAKSYAVCPTCNGVFFKDCSHCAGRGTLSKFHWNSVPVEIQELRQANEN